MSRHHLGVGMCQTLYTQHVFCPGLPLATAALHKNIQCMEKYNL